MFFISWTLIRTVIDFIVPKSNYLRCTIYTHIVQVKYDTYCSSAANISVIYQLSSNYLKIQNFSGQFCCFYVIDDEFITNNNINEIVYTVELRWLEH